jgi:hypothetical protein
MIFSIVGLLIVSSVFPFVAYPSKNKSSVQNSDGSPSYPISHSSYDPFPQRRWTPGPLWLMCKVPGVSFSPSCITELKQTRLAFVKPIFTTSAYQNGFYNFYSLHQKDLATGYSGPDLQLLNVSTYDAWSAEGRTSGFGLYDFIQQFQNKNYLNNIPILTDISVNNGDLNFANGSRRFDVVVLGFTEYVTIAEYNYYKNFVASGGTLIFTDGCSLLAQVIYYPVSNKIALVSGHGWNFNGARAWSGPYSRWSTENTNWIGSDYRLFFREGYKIQNALLSNGNPISNLMLSDFGGAVWSSNYTGHEENVVTNSTDNIIATWKLTNWLNSSETVATYSHAYQNGLVIHAGIFGTDIIATNYEFQFFILVSILSRSYY